jgi:hypothetical protein
VFPHWSGGQKEEQEQIIMKISAAAVFLTLALCGLASANIMPTLTGTSTSLGVTTFSYSLALSAGENVQTGSVFCFSDIEGLTGTESAPAGWTVTTSTSGGCSIPAGITAPNDADSVTYTYTGTTIDGAAALGTFTIQSTDSAVGALMVAYGAATEAVNPPGPDRNQGDVDGPVAANPEPATLSLIGGSLLGLGLVGRKAGRRSRL